MGLLFVLWIFLSYAILPGIVSSFAISLLVAVVVAFLANPLETSYQPLFGYLLEEWLSLRSLEQGGMTFVFFNAYILNNAAFRGQGMGYALLLVPVLAVIGAVLGSIGAAVTQ